MKLGLVIRSWLPAALLTLVLLFALYAVILVYAAGETPLAAIMLATCGLALWLYTSPRTYVYRYLFPGIAAVMIFVIFPMAYTVAIGFTNYSSKNLLEFSRATQYFLDETYMAPGESYQFSLLANGDDYRVRLQDEAGHAFVSPALTLADAAQHEVLMAPVETDLAHWGEVASLKVLIAKQQALKTLGLKLPDGAKLAMTSLREFGPVMALYQATDQGGLRNGQTGETIRANHHSGFYETASGEQLAPGFKVSVGLSHYVRIFTDAAFQGPFFSILVWTLVFAALTVVLCVALGMFLAVLFNWDALRFKGIYRTLLFLPYAVPGFISILVFKGLFNNNFGEINLILNALFGVKPAWFSDPLLAKAMLLIVNVWLGYPYMMILCLGLIKAIPADLYEASAIAGVGPITNFFRITLPLIIRPLMPLMIASFAFNFNNFVLISLLTGGAPDFLHSTTPAGTTDLLVSYTYRIAFEDSGQQFGLAAAISTVIFAMVALIALLQMRMSKLSSSSTP